MSIRREPLDLGYGQTPNGLWNTANLTAGARCLLGWLWSHTDDYLASVTERRCEREFRSRQVRVWLRDLETEGYLGRELVPGHNPQGQWQYVLLADPWRRLCDRPTVEGDAAKLPQGRGEVAEGDAAKLPHLDAAKLPHVEDHVEDQEEHVGAEAPSVASTRLSDGESPSIPTAPLESRSALQDNAQVQTIADHLAGRVEKHRGGTRRPKITAKWLRDIDLLLRRGTLDTDPPATPTAADVIRWIDGVFTLLADPGPSGFCWADQVQSPAKLRTHWARVGVELDKATKLTAVEEDAEWRYQLLVAGDLQGPYWAEAAKRVPGVWLQAAMRGAQHLTGPWSEREWPAWVADCERRIPGFTIPRLARAMLVAAETQVQENRRSHQKPFSGVYEFEALVRLVDDGLLTLDGVSWVDDPDVSMRQWRALAAQAMVENGAPV
jgi:hypothetical protein